MYTKGREHEDRYKSMKDKNSLMEKHERIEHQEEATCTLEVENMRTGTEAGRTIIHSWKSTKGENTR